MSLPKFVYVLEEFEGTETFLVAHKELSDIPEDCHGDVVGVYELKSKPRLKVEKTLNGKGMKWTKKS